MRRTRHPAQGPDIAPGIAEVGLRYVRGAGVRRENEEDEAMSETPRTDAERKAADRRKRINDLTEKYAGDLSAAAFSSWSEIPDAVVSFTVLNARKLATAVVDAEQ
jgi:hypothetical protein